MSYVDQSGKRNPAAVAAVLGTHLAIGYALLSGLAYQIVRLPPPVTTIDFQTDQPPPPPRRETPPPKSRDLSQPPSIVPPTRPTDNIDIKPIVPTFPPPIDIGSGGGGTTEVPTQPPPPNLARDLVPAADRLRWITTEDYPASALRQGIQGSVVISAMIGADGRVRSCLVTQSSGSQLLDDTTCRLYTKRAHFTPARDADGNPITAQRTDRFRWQIPNE
jgi:protein TonB